MEGRRQTDSIPGSSLNPQIYILNNCTGSPEVRIPYKPEPLIVLDSQVRKTSKLDSN